MKEENQPSGYADVVLHDARPADDKMGTRLCGLCKTRVVYCAPRCSELPTGSYEARLSSSHGFVNVVLCGDECRTMLYVLHTCEASFVPETRLSYCKSYTIDRTVRWTFRGTRKLYPRKLGGALSILSINPPPKQEQE